MTPISWPERKFWPLAQVEHLGKNAGDVFGEAGNKSSDGGEVGLGHAKILADEHKPFDTVHRIARQRGHMTSAAADEIAGFLMDRAPRVLKDLKERSGLKRPDEAFSRPVLGDPPDSARATDRKLLSLQAAAAIAAIGELKTVVDRALVVTKSRLSRANLWETFGGVLAVVGTGAAVALLLPAQPDKVQAQIAGVAGIVGSLVSLLVKAMRSTLLAGGDSISKPLGELQDAWVTAIQLMPTLQFASDPEAALSEVLGRKAVDDANDVIRTVRKLLLGFSD